nr:IS3 family transposase [Hathewaya proteolytica]
MSKYEQEFKDKIIRQHLSDGRTLASLSKEYGVNKATICNWVKVYREECQEDPTKNEEKDYFKENLLLKKQLEELEKENKFKKSSGILREGNRLSVYTFIKNYKSEFGVRWLLKKFNLSPNAYYNFLKNRRSKYHTQKQATLGKINEIFHKTNGVVGYRIMKIFLQRQGFNYSYQTVHKYMNKELKLHSIIRRKKPPYIKGDAHKVFPNLLNQDFSVQSPNTVWCTDFTYMYLQNGKTRYNCSILDLYDRSIVSTLNSKEINAELAINTLKTALKKVGKISNKIILHSDQGRQYTSKDFTEFCASNNVVQSMSKAGCPYDNAPMERYFNTFKNEFLNLYNFKTDESLNNAVYDFSYTWYNHVRPHSFNGGLTPFEARYSMKSF